MMDAVGVRIRPTQIEDGLPLRWVDVVITSASTLAAAYLALAARWVPGWWQSALVFAVIAAGPPVLRALARRFSGSKVLEFIASFWLLPSVIAGHCAMGPLVDALNPRLLDGYLARADLRMFGGHPSAMLEPYVGGLITEVLMVCYYTYYLWPVILGMLLYFRGQRAVFDEYLLSLSLFFLVNYSMYVLVPAIGPRFFLAEHFRAPLSGLFLTPYLDSLMRGAAFTRDCFPSGHTGITLLVLVYAFWHRRRFFYAVLPVCTGVIFATVVGRFHYVVDLMCAVPLLMGVLSIASWIARARPEGVVVSKQALAMRAPAQA